MTDTQVCETCGRKRFKPYPRNSGVRCRDKFHPINHTPASEPTDDEVKELNDFGKTLREATGRTAGPEPETPTEEEQKLMRELRHTDHPIDRTLASAATPATDGTEGGLDRRFSKLYTENEINARIEEAVKMAVHMFGGYLTASGEDRTYSVYEMIDQCEAFLAAEGGDIALAVRDTEER